MATDSKKFHDVWVMNEGEAKELVARVLEEDRIIHEQQLGLPWDASDLAFLDNTGPIQSEQTKRKAVSAHQVVREILSAAGRNGDSEAIFFIQAHLYPLDVVPYINICMGQEYCQTICL